MNLSNLLKWPWHDRFRALPLLWAIVLLTSFLTRISLIIFSASQISFSVGEWLGVILIGTFFDFVNAVYFSIPLAFFLWITPGRIFNTSAGRIMLIALFAICWLVLCINAVGEWFFWEEFNTRFNFIAVDYLVYTTEVAGNIKESYPLEWIIPVVVLFAALLSYFSIRFGKPAKTSSMRFAQRSLRFIFFSLLCLSLFFGVSSKGHQFSDNTYANELAGNGMYDLFAAYRNNELDFRRFYQTLSDEECFQLMRRVLKTPGAAYQSADVLDLTRRVTGHGTEIHPNVIMVSVESLSADFMAAFGNQNNITPFLDSLAEHSLFFTNVFATGTRTVRGLEALSLCIPPTPGQSIVRRPQNEHLFSLGKVFREKGYDSKFIYGGYGYFDNMSYFFSNNRYDVVDRSALDDNEIAYENIWGVADENLFTLALREIDKSVNDSKPVFAHIMTTSNHRPFTYPDSRIDIPSHTSRNGAVKYTDYALRKFMQEATSKSWFGNTVFIIVADHCASSAGATELPIQKYHIPLLIYSPGLIHSGRVDRLMSQIDVGPTVLGLLNFNYTTRFFGYDLFNLEPGRERAFISTYQNLGFIKGDKLVILSPHKKTVEVKILDFQNRTVVPMKGEESLIHEAIAWYQSSSYYFTNGYYLE